MDDIIYDREHEDACEAELKAQADAEHQLTYRDYAPSAGKTLPEWIEMRLKIRKMMLKLGHSADAATKLFGNARRNKQRINLWYTDGHPEALALALQYEKLFMQAGWQVGMGASKLPNALAFGVLVDKDSPRVDALADVLRRSGIEFAFAPIPHGLEFNVSRVDGPILLIGSKPR